MSFRLFLALIGFFESCGGYHWLSQQMSWVRNVVVSSLQRMARADVMDTQEDCDTVSEKKIRP